jgi:hypothetical protein
MTSALAELRAELEAGGGLLAEALAPVGALAEPDGAGPAQLAAAGPRAAGSEREYELLVEAIREGYLLHHGRPRIVRAGDPDLALLAGDRLYALGLERLTGLGDVDAVRELADVIALAAAAQASGDEALAEAIWEAGAVAVGWGRSPEHAAAKALAASGDPDAARALRRAAGEARAKLAQSR